MDVLEEGFRKKAEWQNAVKGTILPEQAARCATLRPFPLHRAGRRILTASLYRAKQSDRIFAPVRFVGTYSNLYANYLQYP
ncbi:MAG: hypothetical protein LBI92_08620 [Azoarcus sp.]|jgi:hypothetical protein|nr:hypothetical protein [Azoarcus sp.]